MDIDELNPNWKEACNHGKAMSVGLPPSKEEEPLTSVCPCCLNIINKKPAPFCENVKQLEFIGFGFPLFYSYIKNCILLLLLSICSYNCLSLYWAVRHN